MMRREACVQRSNHRHHASIDYSPDRIWIRITTLDYPKYETTSRTRSNQTNCSIEP